MLILFNSSWYRCGSYGEEVRTNTLDTKAHTVEEDFAFCCCFCSCCLANNCIINHDTDYEMCTEINTDKSIMC